MLIDRILLQTLDLLNVTDLQDCSKLMFWSISNPPIGADLVDRLEEELTSTGLKLATSAVATMQLRPADLGVEHFMSDSVIAGTFEPFFSYEIRRTLRAVNDVHPIYVGAKSRLMTMGQEHNLTGGRTTSISFSTSRIVLEVLKEFRVDQLNDGN